MTSAFWYAEPGRLRTPWRLAVFLLATAGAMIVIQSLVYPIVITLAGWTGSHPSLEGWNLAASLLLAHLAVVRWMDHLSWDTVWLGPRAAKPKAIGVAFIMGAAAIGIPCLVLLTIGWLRRDAASPGSELALAGRAALFFLPYALFEELFLRGYVLRVLRDALGWRWALAATSLVFGALHIRNPGATGVSIALVVLAGICLGAVVLVMESVYAAWAAHFAWNWTMAAVVHASVSGLPFTAVDFRLVDAGPDWATGGAWGPEGGVAAGFGMAAALLFLFSRPQARSLITGARSVDRGGVQHGN